MQACVLRKYENRRNEKWSVNRPTKGNVQLNTSIYTKYLWPLQKWIRGDKIHEKRSHNIHTHILGSCSQHLFPSVKILQILPHKGPNLN